MAKRKPKPKLDQIIAEGPTPERLTRNDFAESWQVADGRRSRAYVSVPPIESMWKAGKLSARQYWALKHYGDAASLSYKSEIKDSTEKLWSPSGGTGGYGGSPWRIDHDRYVGKLEDALGQLRDIAFAITVKQMSLSQWAMDRSGSTMRTREIGAKVITWFEPRRKALKLALVDIRMAGERLAAEIGA